MIWLDIVKPTGDDFAKISEEFGLHALAVEDATAPHERPKLSHYASHLFLIAYAADLDEHADLAIHEVSAFITERALITVRQDDCLDVGDLMNRWDEQKDLARHGVGYLLYGLLDLLVDEHFEALQQLDAEIDEVEDVLFDEAPDSIRRVQQRSFQVRKNLGRLRKVVAPMREIVNGLMRPDSGLVNDQLMPYYHDVYDHVLRVTEWTESQRDFVSTMLDTNVSVQGNRSNTVMKKVTSWAAIIAVPTAITGFYGQNVPFPGYEKHLGFIVSSVLIVLLSIALYVSFKRRDWL
jgi:magnesium transporter